MVRQNNIPNNLVLGLVLRIKGVSRGQGLSISIDNCNARKRFSRTLYLHLFHNDTVEFRRVERD